MFWMAKAIHDYNGLKQNVNKNIFWTHIILVYLDF